MTQKSKSLKDVAYDKVCNDPETQLKVWWAVTYQKPIFHQSVEDYTIEELVMEMYIYRFFSDEDFKKDYEEENGIISSEKAEEEEWLKKMLEDDYVPPPDMKERYSG